MQDWAIASGSEPPITPREPLFSSSRRTAGSICVSSISRQAASSSTGSFAGKRAQMISIATLSGDGWAGCNGEWPLRRRRRRGISGSRRRRRR